MVVIRYPGAFILEQGVLTSATQSSVKMCSVILSLSLRRLSGQLQLTEMFYSSQYRRWI